MAARLFAFAALAIFAGRVEARELWVDRDSLGGTCSDARAASVVTKTAPWCTLASAANKVQPGDNVHVRAGLYTETVGCNGCTYGAVLEVATVGTANAWIRFLAEPGERVQLSPAKGADFGIWIDSATPGVEQPQYVEVAGFEVSGFGNCVFVQGVSDVIVRDLDISGCTGRAALFIGQNSRVTAENNSVHDNALKSWGSAISLWDCGRDNVVRGNRVWNNSDDPYPGCMQGNAPCPDSEGHGIILDYCVAGSTTLVENNVFFENEGFGIVVFHSDGAIVRNNTSYHNGRRADGGEVSILGNRAQVHNNILLPRAGQYGLILRYNQSGVTASTLSENNNLVWAPTHSKVFGWGSGATGTLSDYQQANAAFGQNSLSVDPLLVDAAQHDFRLQATSPALDTGDASHAATVDVLGNARPVDGNGDGTAVIDSGAYEYTAQSSPDPEVPPPGADPTSPPENPGAGQDPHTSDPAGTAPGGTQSGMVGTAGCSMVQGGHDMGLWLATLLLGCVAAARRRRAIRTS